MKNLRQSSARPHPSQDGKSQTTRPPNDQATIHIGPAECAKRLNNGGWGGPGVRSVAPGARKCSPSNCFQALGLDFATRRAEIKPWGWKLANATLPIVFKPWGWKVQPFRVFSRPGAGKCNPSCCFQALWLDNATPLAVFKPWDWTMQPLVLFSRPCCRKVQPRMLL